MTSFQDWLLITLTWQTLPTNLLIYFFVNIRQLGPQRYIRDVYNILVQTNNNGY